VVHSMGIFMKDVLYMTNPQMHCRGFYSSDNVGFDKGGFCIEGLNRCAVATSGQPSPEI